MGHPVDVHVGARIRQRRMIVGLTQQNLAETIGVTFQQIQKYEIGANRVSASRLWEIARLLNVPIGFFFEGLTPARPGGEDPADSPAEAGAEADPLAALGDLPLDRDAAQLLRSFCAIPTAQRRRLLDLARALSDPAA